MNKKIKECRMNDDDAESSLTTTQLEVVEISQAGVQR
jgi:hypothetical protein